MIRPVAPFSAAVLAAVLAAALAGCLGAERAFTCADDQACDNGGAQGTCQSSGFCSFPDSACDSGQRYGDHAGSMSNLCVGADTLGDGGLLPDGNTPDGGPVLCTPGTKQCSGSDLQTCNAAGNGYDVETCAYTCDVDHCVYASNLPLAAYADCPVGGAQPDLTPPTGATVTIEGGTPSIVCDPDCGDGTTTSIPAIGAIEQGDTDAHWFCLGAITIPGDVTVTLNQNVRTSVLLFADASVAINGSIDVSGATPEGGGGNDVGEGGPGGFDGAKRAGNNNDGTAGEGLCPGLGGIEEPDNYGGGGGGGGAYGGNGGTGGIGTNGDEDQFGAGGAGGTACAVAQLIPLVGGSGGGSGADGECNNCGRPGGGGGGALQVTSRISITVDGSIISRGGNGYGETGTSGNNLDVGNGGGGGGGSGGAVLLEAPSILVGGSINVDGGAGGVSNAGAGGAGATLTLANGSVGADHQDPFNSGSGGGGGGGQVRLNSIGTALACGVFVSPAPVCTAGDLSTTAQ